MRMKKERDTRLEEEAELLDRYLSQYRHCINKKKSLEHRRKEIEREFNAPLSSVNMDGMPRGSSVGVGCAALSYRLDEINTRIEAQLATATKILTDTMSIIDFLPENSKERFVVEYRYIDRYSWERISREAYISRSSAIRYWKNGLQFLLKFKKVRQVLREFADEAKF